ncbi:von willebrand factor [Moniliophthora roreri]|nr:von willebrand factor [Moniliophthora roreri]
MMSSSFARFRSNAQVDETLNRSYKWGDDESATRLFTCLDNDLKKELGARSILSSEERQQEFKNELECLMIHFASVSPL